ncbi:hypothetical protein [Flavobacterium sp. LM4]|uniref:hypothetical protein n=1 Tax=Flavobacterium sp. LM4 TaxID=1938609 RepID=UPI000992EFBC|nr:hypothetical protein [Flavobacterium sp. LM4]OOV17567.1 hypothetical protein BXU10_15920 [Flavobacterium sp. LM4]
MKKIILIGCVILSSLQLSAQKLVNYDKNGEQLKTVTDYLEISATGASAEKSNEGLIAAPAVAIPALLLGPVFNIASTAIKNGLEKKQKSYTASYSNSGEFSTNEIKTKSLLIKRYAIDKLTDIDEEHLMAKYVLTLKSDGNSTLIKLDSILLKKSKARYKKNDNLSLSINIKAVSSHLNEENKTELISSEGTIIIPIFKVDGTEQYLGDKNIINPVRLNGISLDTSNTIKFAVNISETNITRIDPSKIQTLISNNSDDIQSILKIIFNVEN